MTETLGQSLGGVSFDGADELTNSLYSTLFPTLAPLTEWLKAALIAEYSCKGWNSAANGTVLEGRAPVEATVNRDPSKELMQSQLLSFPLLFVHPIAGRSSELTLQKVASHLTWRIGYTLGPLDPKDHARLAAAVYGFPSLVVLCFQNKLHPAYANGDVQLAEGASNFSEIKLIDFKYGDAPFAEGQHAHVPAVELEVETMSLSNDEGTDAVAVEGFDLIAHNTGPGGTLFNALEGTV